MTTSKDTRFIGLFVNSVYGTLLGVGFTLILWDLFKDSKAGLDTTLFAYHSLVAIFVIVVICMYWWDWSENIEAKVESTFSEFIIDIGILVTLESMCFNFRDSEDLAISFIILSILNLIWVTNFIWIQYKKRENIKLNRYLVETNGYHYLLKKMAAIILYGMCFAVLTVINKWYWLEGLLIIFTFVLVRYVSYKGRSFLDNTSLTNKVRLCEERTTI